MYQLETSDIPRFKGLITEAFMQDPLFIAYQRDEAKRRRIIFDIFELILEFSPGEIEVYAPSEKMEGVAIWVDQRKPASPQVGFAKVLSTYTGI